MSGEDDAHNAAQTVDLFDRLLEAFTTWAKAAGHNVDKWTVSKGSGQPINPLGDECSWYEAALSLQRIAEMAAINPATLVSCFHYQKSEGAPTEMPCELTKKGQATLVLWATWDGEEEQVGLTMLSQPQPPRPNKAAVLVSLEGCGPEQGKWLDPVKLYAFMEYGFHLGRYTPTTAIPIPMATSFEEDPPF